MTSPSSFLDLASRHQAYSRKQKSLGLLCSNFVRLYDRDGVESIGLDDAARRLGVERRRIYDIVNVLEIVGVLARKAKNQYSWMGFSGIPKALDDLKEEALREISGCPTYEKVPDDEEDDEYGEEKLSQTTNGSSNSGPHKGRSDSKREKSLGQLTQNFVKLFLTTAADTISLDEAARLLLGDGLDSCQLRKNNAAKVRRLYDIGNVLCSMNLIEKTQQVETRKPAFRWLGTKGKPSSGSNGVTIAVPSNAKSSKQWRKRAFGTEITNVDSKRSKLTSLMDKKPFREQIRSDDLKECNLTAQMQLGGTKSYVFGPFRPVEVPKACRTVDERGSGQTVQDWENMASSFRPQYHNQALNELFAHYMEAWKSWYSEITQGSNTQLPCKSITSQLF